MLLFLLRHHRINKGLRLDLCQSFFILFVVLFEVCELFWRDLRHGCCLLPGALRVWLLRSGVRRCVFDIQIRLTTSDEPDSELVVDSSGSSSRGII